MIFFTSLPFSDECLLQFQRLAVFVAMVHVLAVRAGVREPFATFIALEWLFAAVQAFVLGQVVFVFEGFPADVAGERAGS